MDLLTKLGAAALALLALGALARGVWRINRRTVIIENAVKELAPNGGESIKDVVHRTEGKVDDAAEKLSELAERFDAHLAEHARAPR